MNKNALIVLLVLISNISIGSWVLQWIVNQWANYFEIKEITFWQSFSIFVFLTMCAYYVVIVKVYWKQPK